MPNDKEEDEIPSPPPFYRVSGHFTALNPSRPMALANLMKQAALSDNKTDTNSTTAQNEFMVDMTDLFGDNNSNISQKGIFPTQDEDSSSLPSLERADFFAPNNETETGMNHQYTNKAQGESIGLAALSLTPSQKDPLSNARLVPTPQGLARLLKSHNDAINPTFAPPLQGLVGATPTTSSFSSVIFSVPNPPAPPRRQHVRWTEEEDELLRVAVEIEEGPPHNWKKISKKYFHESRNAMACKGRWNKSLQPGLVHAKWTAHEEEIVLLGHQAGLSWPQIAAKLPGRTPEQIRYRFLNDIDPTLNRDPFTESEKRKVRELQAQYGNKWTQISSEMPGRSESMVKNCWFNAQMSHRRKLRRMNSKKEEESSSSSLSGASQV